MTIPIETAETALSQSPQNSANRPFHTIRLGRIKAILWRNETSVGTRFNLTLCRLFKDDEGHWKSVDSFGRDDLPLLCKVIDQAHTWLFSQAESSSFEAPALHDWKSDRPEK